MTVDQVLAAYLQLRDQKEALAKDHKLAMAPLNDQMNKCLAWVQQQLQKQGLQNFRGESGMAFLQTDTSVTVKDWQATFEWIKSQDAWEFLEKRVSKAVTQEYIEAHGEIPPGLNVTSEVSAHIRKS